jgi:radical SAM superfamily enzyme YgiQ (UPF0313 family)
MVDVPIFLIAFLEQDNLGIGYIASVLKRSGFKVKIIDFRIGKEAILEHIVRINPTIIGFSIIFQYHIESFKNLIVFLRNHEIDCHFCAGGHYPSLRYKELLSTIPQLDSVVLFEGEYTFLELVQSLYTGKDLKNIQGIAYNHDEGTMLTSLRPLEEDLDNFPPPLRREPLREYAIGKKYATLLAGRGCFYNCSFCSIKEFYSKPPGKIKRLRAPEMVVKEMELLHEEMDCWIFLFQDDDFPAAGYTGKKWLNEFCNILTERGLSKKILWKINCRPDEIDSDTFAFMRDCGLFLAYLGIESGTEQSLNLMKKRFVPEVSINAVNALKKLGIGYDFGFMLFDPTSTYRSISDNLDFLENICGDGSSSITFCKMLPYAGTTIESQLRKEGRLKGKIGFENYDFYDVSINDLYAMISRCFHDWNGDNSGFLNNSSWVRYYLSVYEKYCPITDEFKHLKKIVQQLLAQANLYFINTARKLLSIFKSTDYKNNRDTLYRTIEDVSVNHKNFNGKCKELISQIDYLGQKFL